MPKVKALIAPALSLSLSSSLPLYAIENVMATPLCINDMRVLPVRRVEAAGAVATFLISALKSPLSAERQNH